MSSFDELIQIMARLRAPGGCPWDHEQTHESILPQLIEETYEVIEAIESKNYSNLCEELGDLLLHVVFHAQMANERGDFSIQDVVEGLKAKLIRRHPHVFGDTKVKDAGEVMKNWDAIKAEEKKDQPQKSVLDGVPKALPALFQSYKLSKKASKVGFDWKKTEDVLPKIREEVEELEAEFHKKDPKGMEHELGDVFFAIANLSRLLGLQPEIALRKSNERFRKRFASMERQIQKKDQSMQDLTASQWEEFWENAKKECPK